MSATRHRKNHKIYEKYTQEIRGTNCQFCDFNAQDSQVLSELKSFWIVKNIFPYDIWDTSQVSDHLMVVPKRHVDSISHFDNSEKQEYVTALAEYEKQGYSIYARAPTNVIKSVVHQHTHLIKMDSNSIKKFILYFRRPRMLLTR